MDSTELLKRLDGEIEAVLSSVVATDADDLAGHWAGRLFDALVDLFLESIILGLVDEVRAGVLSMAAYRNELEALAEQCRRAGLSRPV